MHIPDTHTSHCPAFEGILSALKLIVLGDEMNCFNKDSWLIRKVIKAILWESLTPEVSIHPWWGCIWTGNDCLQFHKFSNEETEFFLHIEGSSSLRTSVI